MELRRSIQRSHCISLSKRETKTTPISISFQGSEYQISKPISIQQNNLILLIRTRLEGSESRSAEGN
ncbi:hypothetical protein AAC387_Pa03g2078 [Persea americana]